MENTITILEKTCRNDNNNKKNEENNPITFKNDFNDNNHNDFLKEKDHQINVLSKELSKSKQMIKDLKELLDEIVKNNSNVCQCSHHIDNDNDDNKKINQEKKDQCIQVVEKEVLLLFNKKNDNNNNNCFDLVDHYKNKCERLQKEMEKKTMELEIANQLIESLSIQISKVYDDCYGSSNCNYLNY